MSQPHGLRLCVGQRPVSGPGAQVHPTQTGVARVMQCERVARLRTPWRSTDTNAVALGPAALTAALSASHDSLLRRRRAHRPTGPQAHRPRMSRSPSTAPVAGITTITANRIMLAVAEVGVHFALQRGFQHQLRQLPEQAALAGHAQPLGAGPGHQPGHKLLIHHQPRRRYCSPRIHLDRYRCLLTSKELHR